jgi:UDP-glucose 4-epimerase
MELREKRIVVTGGAGFIGSHVVDRLVAIGASVVAVDDLSVGTRENLRSAQAAGAELVVGDIRDVPFMEEVLQDTALVIHMACDNLRASLGNPMRTHEINASGTLVTCLAAVRAGVHRFVYVSSSEAYGSAITIPMTEDHPLLPTTVYGASKAAGELYAQACMRTYALPVTVIRPFNSYGPREHSSGTSAEVIPKFVARISAGLPPVIFGDGSQTRDFTWVEETAVGIVAAASCDALVGESINIAYGKGVTIREICDRLLEILDADDLAPEFTDPRPGDVEHHYADTSKAVKVLGFEAEVPVHEGLARYVDWVRSTSSDEREAAEPQRVRNW